MVRSDFGLLHYFTCELSALSVQKRVFGNINDIILNIQNKERGDLLFIANSFFENHLNILNGDCIKLYLHRIYNGLMDDYAQLSTKLDIPIDKMTVYIEKLTELDLWNRCFKDYMSEMQNMEFPDFLYSCNCNLSKQTKEWLSLMSLADFSDLTKVSQKYESTILCIDQLWNHHLSIEYIFLILYLGECLDLPQAVIKYIFVNKGLNHDIDSIELTAALISDFDLKDVESIEYHYSNSIYYFKAVAEVFSIHKLPSYSDMSYIVNWCVHHRLSLEMVVFACLYTKNRIEQFVIAYTDKVLMNWINEDIYTTDDIIKQRKIRRMPISEQRLLQQQARKIADDIQNTPIEELLI